MEGSNSTFQSMIVTFEDFTVELSESRKAVAKQVADYFNNSAKGKISALTNREISNRFDSSMHSAHVRKLIQYIRLNGMVKNLIATSDGYYVSSDENEIQTYKKSLRQRAVAILQIEKSFA